MEHRAELDRLPKALTNQREPLLYGDRLLIDHGLLAGFESVLDLGRRRRGIEGGIDLRPNGTFNSTTSVTLNS